MLESESLNPHSKLPLPPKKNKRLLLKKSQPKNPAEMRALASPMTTPQKGDTSLSRSQPSSVKVSRRSRSKSPFRSFRWKRSSKLDSDDEEGIHLIIYFRFFLEGRFWWNFEREIPEPEAFYKIFKIK